MRSDDASEVVDSAQKDVAVQDLLFAAHSPEAMKMLIEHCVSLYDTASAVRNRAGGAQ